MGQPLNLSKSSKLHKCPTNNNNEYTYRSSRLAVVFANTSSNDVSRVVGHTFVMSSVPTSCSITLEATSVFVNVFSCPFNSTPSLLLSTDEALENHGPCPSPSQSVVGECGFKECMLQINLCKDNLGGGETILVGKK